MWEERGGKEKKKQRAWEKEQKQSLAGTLMQEVKKVLKVEAEEIKACREKASVSQKGPETQTKLLQVEDAITDMKKQLCHLQASLKPVQDCAEQKHTSQAPHIHRKGEAERQQPDESLRKAVSDQGDSAAVGEPEKTSALEAKQTEAQATSGGLLVTLQRIEAMVSSALGMAELVRHNEQKVSQVREKMGSITQKVEEAMGRADSKAESLEIRKQHPSEVCHL